MKKALFFKSLDQKKVQCMLCPHQCIIYPEKTGICQVRKNIDGILYSLVYGKPVAKSIDPIEKKPLFHFYPGSKSYSIATVGCNMKCKHCQNYDISQSSVDESFDQFVSPEEIVQSAVASHSTSIAYTYTEPTIYYEYAYDIAKIAHEHNLKNVFVTNGYITTEALDYIAPLIDGANIDLKSMRDEFYTSICGSHLQPVLDSIQRYHEHGIWVEITTLIIPGYNDKKDELKQIAEFIYHLDKNIPWHVTGFHPTYKLTNAPSTKPTQLEQAVDIGKKVGLKYIYQGNILQGEDTICPTCGTLLIKRRGFSIQENNINQGKCPSCQLSISGKMVDVKEE